MTQSISRQLLSSRLSRAAGLAVFAVATQALASAQQPIQSRMGEPLPGLTPAQLDRFNTGLDSFNHILTPSEGLGPIFNDTSCQHCHLSPMPGGSSTKFVTRFGIAATGSAPFDPMDALGGSLLQKSSINTPTCDEVVPANADVTTHRVTPPIFGYGVVEAIDDSDILVNAVFPPPGVSGRAHQMHPLEDPNGQLRVGRFGWKAQVPTLLTFSADAGLNETGLTSRFLTMDNAPNGDLVRLAQCDAAPIDPEDHPDAQGREMIDRWTDFQKFLAPPPQTPRSGMSGEAIFTSIGCGSCHLTSTFTASPAAENGIANVTIKPYSDFLLHDMGSLGDGIVQGQAHENDFRTAPLWGVGHRAQFGLLHDARATGNTAEQNLDDSIMDHDGEAATIRANYFALPPADKAKVQAFLLSLGRAEFDAEYNNNVDEIDWFFLRPTLTGPGSFFNADDDRAVADFDQDGDFDLRDIAAMQRAFTGT
jgi:hypothetical protein